MYFDLGSFTRQASEKIVSAGRCAGNVAKVAVEFGKKQYEKGQETANRAYEEGVKLSNRALVDRAFHSSPAERIGYKRVIQERGLSYQDENGKWVGTEELNDLIKKVTR